MTPKIAYESLVDKVNIEFYIGPYAAKAIQQACVGNEEETAPLTVKEAAKPAPTSKLNTKVNPVVKAAVSKQPVVKASK